MGFSFWHLIVVLFAIIVLFGLGKLPKAMGDVAKGIRAFKREMENDDDPVEGKKPLAAPSKDDDAKVVFSEKDGQKH
jgi:sec-independent protein translocase protein TatA